MQALQISVPQIPEQQKQQLDVLRQSWLKAEQTRSRSGQLNLQDIASWLSAAGRKDDDPKEQVYFYIYYCYTVTSGKEWLSVFDCICCAKLANNKCHRYMCMQASHEATARSAQVSPPAPQTHSLPPPPSLHLPPPPPRHTVPSAIPPNPSTKQPPPFHSNQPHRHDLSNMPACGPTQQRQSNRKSQWDVPPNPVESTWNSQPHGHQPEQHAARQSIHSRDASPEQLAQRLKGFSLQPADLAGEPSSCLLQGGAHKLGNRFTAVARCDSSALQVTVLADTRQALSQALCNQANLHLRMLQPHFRSLLFAYSQTSLTLQYHSVAANKTPTAIAALLLGTAH